MMGSAVPSGRQKHPAAALRRSARGLRLTTALVAVAMAAGSAPLLAKGAKAAPQSWDGGDGTWDIGTTAHWNGGQFWTDHEDAIFGGTSGIVTIDDTGGGIDVNSLTFTVGGYTLTGDGFTLSSNPAVIEVVGGATATIDAAFSNPIAGAGIQKYGGGTLVLTKANVFTGGTTLNEGTITLSGVGTLGSGAININGGTLRGGTTITVANAIANTIGGTSTFLAANGTTLTLSGIAVHPSGDGRVAGHMTFGSSSDDGIIIFGGGAGAGSVTSGTVIEVAGGTLRTTGADFGLVSSANGSPASDITVQVDSGATLDLNNTDTTINILKGDAGAIVTAGTGDLTLIRGDYAGSVTATTLTKASTGTLTLSGSNNFSGGTTISGGTLVAGNAAALGTGMITFAGDTTLRIGFDGTLANQILGSPGASPTIGFGAQTVLLSDGSTFEYSGGSGTMLHFGETGDTGTLTFAPGPVISDPGGAWSLDGGTLRLGNTNASGLLGGLSAPNLATGTTLDLNGNALELKSPTGSGTILNNGSGPATLSLSGTSAFAGSIRNGTQRVSVTKIGTGTTTLSGVNTYTGITNVLDGTLALSGAGSIADSSSVSLASGATFDISQTTAGASVNSLSGDIGSSVSLGSKTLTVTNSAGALLSGEFSDGGAGGGLTLAGGSLIFSGIATYTGTTSIGDSGILTNIGSIAGAVTNAGTFDNYGLISGLLTNSMGTTTNSGPVLGGVLVTGGMLNTTGMIVGGLTSSATVNASGTINGTIFNQSGGSFNVTGALVGGFYFSNDNGASLSVAAGDLTDAAGLTNNGAVSVSTGRSMTVGGLNGTASAATLGTTGSATFAFGANNSDGTYAGSFTGSGTITKNGTGIEVLTGSNGTGGQFTGIFDIDAGRLQVDGILGDTAGNAATVNVNAGGALGGNGTIAGDVFSHAGTISAGASPGVLAIAGDLDLDAATVSLFEMGSPGVVGGMPGANNDFIHVGGDLDLDGILALKAADGVSQITAGYYTLYEVGGTVTDTGDPANGFHTIDSGALSTDIYETTVAGGATRINVLVGGASAQLMQFWDGTDTLGNNSIDGGGGDWNAANTNWTNLSGTINDGWRSGVGIFQGAAGTVTVAGPLDFQGLQFNTSGYVVTGASLDMTGDGAPGGNADASFITVAGGATATIASDLTGKGLDKIVGGGTLLLSGDNSYIGQTRVSTGTLVAGSATAFGNSGNRLQVDAAGVADLGGFAIAQATVDLSGNGEIRNGTLVVGTAFTQSGGTMAATSTTPLYTLSGGTMSGTVAAPAYDQSGGLTSGTVTAADYNLSGGTLSGTANGGTFDLSGSGAVSAAGRINIAAGGAVTQSGGTMAGMVAGAGGTGSAPLYTLAAGTMAGTVDASAYDMTGGLTSGTVNASTAIQSGGTMAGAANVATYSLTGGTLSGTATATTLFDMQEGLVSGHLAGAGGLIKSGTGAVTLEAANSYTGGTTVSDGLLGAAATGALGSGPVSINATGDLHFTGDASAETLAISLTGGGYMSFHQDASAGNAVIDNGGRINFYDGSTAGDAIIDNRIALSFNGDSSAGASGITNSGTLDFYADATVGSAVITNDVGGTLRFHGANTAGDGTVVNNGSGTVDISGLTAAGIAIGSLSGDGNVQLGSKNLTLGGLGLNDKIDGVIAGTGGGLVKIGDGVLTLNGANTYTGPTTVNDGKLVVGDPTHADATIAGPVTVGNGAILGGTGTVGTLTVASGGTVAPGNSPGTLTVAGDVTFATGSAYEVEVVPGGTVSDLIHATGKATLNGGSVVHLGEAGTYKAGATYTILTADTGVSGTFATVDSTFAFLDPSLTYDAGNVFLHLVRNDVDFGAVGTTPNQRNTGEGVDSLGNGDPVWNAIAVLNDDDDARSAFNTLSGEVHASIKTMLLDSSHFFRDAATDRVRAAFAGSTTPLMPVMAYGGDGFTPAPADTERLAVWIRGFGSWGEWGSDGNASGFDRSTGGVFLGADGLVTEKLRLGLIAGYSHSSFGVDGRASSGSSEDYHLGLYGGSQWGGLGLRFGAAYSWHNIETARSVAFPGFTESLSADYDAAAAQAFGELGYRIDTQTASFEPFAGLAYINLHTDGFTERGGVSALESASTDTDATFTTLGIRASTNFMLGTTSVKARGMIGWRHAYGDITPLSRVSFAGGGAFTIAGTPIAEDAAVIEAGLDFGIAHNAIFGLSYSGQIASGGAHDHGFKADFRMEF